MVATLKTPRVLIERLRVAMKRQKVSQSELGSILSVDKATISRWFQSKSEVSPNHYKALCLSLDVSMDWLVFGVEPIKKMAPKNDEEILMLTALRIQKPDVRKSLLFLVNNWKTLRKNNLTKKNKPLPKKKTTKKAKS